LIDAAQPESFQGRESSLAQPPRGVGSIEVYSSRRPLLVVDRPFSCEDARSPDD
jgi:hypothetical protein